MNTTSVAPFVVMREITRLLEVYARPKYWPASDEAIARRWADIFDGISDEQLSSAVSLHIRGDHSFMPKPGQLRALAQKQPRSDIAGDGDSFHGWLKNGYQDAQGSLAPCPACGRAWQAHPRVTLVHDHSQHRMLGLPCMGSCDELACLGTYSVMPNGEAPARMSAGELWIAPADWPKTQAEHWRARDARRDAIKQLRELPPPEPQP